MNKLILCFSPFLLAACQQESESRIALTPGIELSSFGLITEADSASHWYVQFEATAQVGGATSQESYVQLKTGGQGGEATFQESYDMLSGKSRHCSNTGQTTVYVLSDFAGHTQVLELCRLSDGVAFRYTLGDGYEKPVRLLGEHSTLTLAPGSNRWLMRWSDSYEDFYPLNPADSAGCHWGYPALVESPDKSFALLTEANITRGHSASSLYTVGDLAYNIRPDRQDSLVSTGFVSPWRLLITGSLEQIVQSTAVTDLSQPCALADTSWIEPGVVSWIYWAYNHGSNDYDIVRRYVDMAAELHLPYVLIDAEWDEMPAHSRGHQSIEDALKYAHQKGIKPMIWYNSCIGWVNGAPGPKWRLNDPEKREAEFQWCEDHGVAGVKIDFFSGDTEANMNYCIDLLESAARHHLLVNFHGATIPRGWMRTYPHLLSTEAVYGAEWYNNKPVLTRRAAAHNATLPFTRGVIGSMDYTPCTFTDSQHPHITTHAHELALTVLFESGLLHLADRPSAYLTQPQAVRDFFTALPAAWDETRLLDGYPAHHVVMARRRGNVWYVAGINGTDEPLSVALHLDTILKPGVEIRLFEDSGLSVTNPDAELWRITDTQVLPDSLLLMPRGGFVAFTK